VGFFVGECFSPFSGILQAVFYFLRLIKEGYRFPRQNTRTFSKRKSSHKGFSPHFFFESMICLEGDRGLFHMPLEMWP